MDRKSKQIHLTPHQPTIESVPVVSRLAKNLLIKRFATTTELSTPQINMANRLCTDKGAFEWITKTNAHLMQPYAPQPLRKKPANTPRIR